MREYGKKGRAHKSGKKVPRADVVSAERAPVSAMALTEEQQLDLNDVVNEYIYYNQPTTEH